MDFRTDVTQGPGIQQLMEVVKKRVIASCDHPLNGYAAA